MKELIWNELELVYISDYVIINSLEYSIYRECHQQKRGRQEKKNLYRHKKEIVLFDLKKILFFPP